MIGKPPKKNPERDLRQRIANVKQEIAWLSAPSELGEAHERNIRSRWNERLVELEPHLAELKRQLAELKAEAKNADDGSASSDSHAVGSFDGEPPKEDETRDETFTAKDVTEREQAKVDEKLARDRAEVERVLAAAEALIPAAEAKTEDAWQAYYAASDDEDGLVALARAYRSAVDAMFGVMKSADVARGKLAKLDSPEERARRLANERRFAELRERKSNSRGGDEMTRKTNGSKVPALTAALDAMEKAGGTMKLSDICEAVLATPGVHLTGKTPSATIASHLYVAAKKGKVKKVGKGEFALVATTEPEEVVKLNGNAPEAEKVEVTPDPKPAKKPAKKRTRKVAAKA